MDKWPGCNALGPRFKTYLGAIEKLNFYRNFTLFSTFSQNENSPYKTASPQTNFGLYNIRSEMPTFRARVIYFWQLSIESPCMMYGHFPKINLLWVEFRFYVICHLEQIKVDKRWWNFLWVTIGWPSNAPFATAAFWNFFVKILTYNINELIWTEWQSKNQ